MTHQRKMVIGVMGPGEGATDLDIKRAFHLGQLIAQKGWILLTGGRNVGVMEAASQGAKSEGGLTIGILPTPHAENVSDSVDIAIKTDLGNGRNNINVLSSDVVIACGMGLGTASEVALALKNDKPAILLGDNPLNIQFFQQFSLNHFWSVATVTEAITVTEEILYQNAFR